MPLTILIVDDSHDAADTLAVLLELGNHNVRVAYNGREALKLMAEAKPDVLLLDLALPGLNGLDVARAIRKQPNLDSVRLVAVSGYARPEDRAATKAAGFDEHLAKPANLGEICAALSEWDHGN